MGFRTFSRANCRVSMELVRRRTKSSKRSAQRREIGFGVADAIRARNWTRVFAYLLVLHELDILNGFVTRPEDSIAVLQEMTIAARTLEPGKDRDCVLLFLRGMRDWPGVEDQMVCLLRAQLRITLESKVVEDHGLQYA